MQVFRSAFVPLLIPLKPGQLCPCESRKLPEKCCVKDGSVFTRHARLFYGREKTGFSNTKCYLRHLQDCSEKITREHFIPKALLKMIAGAAFGGKGIRISKPGALRDASEFRPFDGFTSKILCSRHNNDLSPIDASLSRLLSQMAADQGFHADVPGKKMLYPLGKSKRLRFFSGYDLERGMAKLLAGLLASKFFNLTFHLDKRFDETLAFQIVEPRLDAQTGGLYFIHRPHRRNAKTNGFQTLPLIAQIDGKDTLFGLDLLFGPFTLRYLVYEVGGEWSMGDLRKEDFIQWRPTRMSDDRRTHVTHISWWVMGPSQEAVDSIQLASHRVGPIGDA